MERIELQRNRDFGDILSDTFGLVKQNFLPLLKCYAAICGVFLLASIAVAFVNKAQRDAMLPLEFVLSGYYWLQTLLSLVSYTAMALTVTAYLAVYKEKGNQPAEVAEVWGYFKYYFFRLFIMLFVTMIITVFGTIMCIVPGIYFAVVFTLVTPVMVIENGSIEYTFRRVFQVIKGNWWSTFGVVLLMFLLVIIAALVIIIPIAIFTGLGQWLSGKNLNGSYDNLEAVISAVGHIFYVVPTIAIVLVYFDLTEEKESNSLAGRIKSFGQSAHGNSAGQSTEQY